MSKINDNIVKHFVDLYLDLISEDTDQEKEKSIRQLDRLFKEIKLKARIIDEDYYQYSLEIDEKQLISNKQTSKLIAFVIQPLSGLDIVIENDNLIELGSNLRIVLLDPTKDMGKVQFDVGIFESLLSS